MNYTLGIILSLLFSAFFSGMEIAYLSSNKLRLELDKKQGFLTARIISVFTGNPGQYIATMLVGNSLCLVIFGLLTVRVFEPFIEQFVASHIYVVIIQTALSTLLILVTAEFLPKTIFMLIPNISLRIFALPTLFFYILFYPISSFVNMLSIMLLRVFKIKISKRPNPYIFDKIDLDNLLQEAQENELSNRKSEYEMKVFQNALDFSNVKLRECIVPRTEVVAIDEDSSVEEITEVFIKSGFSKILVYKDNIDNIIGYFSSKDLFKNPQSIKSKIINPVIVPETMNANKLLRILLQEHKTLAVVVDEFGGTSGIVTIEDIMEEIFGEIEDEHDTVTYVEKKISDNEFIFSTRLSIEHLNAQYALGLPESVDYETLAGFILYGLGRIPHNSEVFIIRHYEFKVLKANNHKIELVMMKVISE